MTRRNTKELRPGQRSQRGKVFWRFLFFSLALCEHALLSTAVAQKVDTLIPVHDPVLIRQGDTYYLFATGNGISTWVSPDLKSWKRMRPVFSGPPRWAVEAVPGFRGHIWAPDI